MQNALPVKVFRWSVFLLAVGYLIHTVLVAQWAFGGPFRYLTVWALCLSAVVAGRVLMLSHGLSANRLDGFVSATAVVNAMVVFLYWRLYFANPMSVTANGELGKPWREYYMHGLGPLLMWVDAVFINRVFRRMWAGAMWLVGIVVAYVVWTEKLVQRFNDAPTGNVTSGLPYRFLNNLEFADRAAFYGTNIVVALALLLVFAAVAWMVRRVL